MYNQKSTGVAYLLLIFLGFFGAHRFYIGRHVSGVIYLLTCGLFFFGVIYDLFALAGIVRQVNLENQMMLNAMNGGGHQSQNNSQSVNINIDPSMLQGLKDSDQEPSAVVK